MTDHPGQHGAFPAHWKPTERCLTFDRKALLHGSRNTHSQRCEYHGKNGSSKPSRIRRFTTETKQAFKTTEFWAMVGVIVAILVSAAVIKGGDTNGTDEFVAKQAWLYVAIVAGAYFISRGLAKSGSYDPYTDEDRS